MNNTKKAKYETAKKMLKCNIAIEEVASMLHLTVMELKPVKREVEEEEYKAFGNVDPYDFVMKQMKFDAAGEVVDIPDKEK